MNFYIYPGLFERIQACINYCWVGVIDGTKYYGSECDVAMIVRNYLESFIEPLGIKVRICSEMGIQSIRSDVLVLSKDSVLVGVVEVKKPSATILEEATVIGELYDQMKLIQLFYQTGPAIGILTTGQQFIVCWFPEDHHLLSTEPQSVLSSAVQSISSSSGGTSVIPVSDCDRRLYCTHTLDSCTDAVLLGQILATALVRMSSARHGHYAEESHHHIRFHLGSLKRVTWCPLTVSTRTELESLLSRIPIDRMPPAKIQSLLAVKDLGRGSNGKAWLATTDAKSSVCVLKFHNSNDESALRREEHFWKILYPHLSRDVRVDLWSGEFALVMPRLLDIPDKARSSFKSSIGELLERIHSSGLWHNDVRWANIGYYCQPDSGDIKLPVLYDLIHIHEHDAEKCVNWVQKGMVGLFP